jgi:hypothetical protein
MTEALGTSTFTRYVASGGFDSDVQWAFSQVGGGVATALNAIFNSGPAIHQALDQIDNWPNAYHPVTFTNIAPPPNLSYPPLSYPPDIQPVTLSAPPITPVTIPNPPVVTVPVLSPPPNINSITVNIPPVNTGNPIVDAALGGLPNIGSSVFTPLANAGISFANDVTHAGIYIANNLAPLFVPIGNDIMAAGVSAGQALAGTFVPIGGDIQRAGISAGNAIVGFGIGAANDIQHAGVTAVNTVANFAVDSANDVARWGVGVANTLASTFVPVGNQIASGTIYAGTQLAHGVVSLPLIIGNAVTSAWNSASPDEKDAAVGFFQTGHIPVGPGCFPAFTTVECEDGTTVRMDQLEKGMKVRVGRGAFSEVFMWLIYQPETLGRFIKFETESGALMHISEHHYIHTWEANRQDWVDRVLLTGEEVQVGHFVMVNGTLNKVVKVERVTETGVFSPVTLEGSIVVDSVLASCACTYEDLVGKFAKTWYLFGNKSLPPMMAHHWVMKKVWSWFGQKGMDFMDAVHRPLYRLAGWRCPTDVIKSM